jgi:hypothetical protein
VTSLKTERLAFESEQASKVDNIDPIHKFSEEPKQLKDMHKQFQTRLGFFTDFYKSVKTYK